MCLSVPLKEGRNFDMKDAKNIYLVGFMGTGKSAVARELSKKLNRKSLDLDEVIEKKEKRKIKDIFAKEGEGYFRKIEKQTLIEISILKDLVVACGGGIVLDENNIKKMKENGIIICLSASSDVIFERTIRSNYRPLLNVDNPKLRIKELLNLRAPFYAKADYTIDSSNLEVKKVVDIIIKNILPKC